jgi:hypothetical protein
LIRYSANANMDLHVQFAVLIAHGVAVQGVAIELQLD